MPSVQVNPTGAFIHAGSRGLTGQVLFALGRAQRLCLFLCGSKWSHFFLLCTNSPIYGSIFLTEAETYFLYTFQTYVQILSVSHSTGEVCSACRHACKLHRGKPAVDSRPN